MEPRSIKARPSAASMGCWVERTEGSSTTETISPNSALGDARAKAWRTLSALNRYSAEVISREAKRPAIQGEKIGDRIVRNSHSQPAVGAAVPDEGNTAESSMASPSHTPP